MILPEDEAKQKWCPWVRMGDGAHNRWSTEADNLGLVGCSCVASACMAWRPVPSVGKGHGYCGAAGPSDSVRKVKP